MSARDIDIEKLRMAAMKASMINVEALSIGGTTGLGIPIIRQQMFKGICYT